jgi:MFS family permease
MAVHAFKFSALGGARRLVPWGLALSGLGHVLMCVPITPVSLIFRMAHGAGDATMMMVVYTGVGDLFRTERLGGHSGLFTFVMLAASFTGSLLFGALAAGCGASAPLIASGALTLALIPAVRLLRPRGGNATLPAQEGT